MAPPIGEAERAPEVTPPAAPPVREAKRAPKSAPRVTPPIREAERAPEAPRVAPPIREAEKAPEVAPRAASSQREKEESGESSSGEEDDRSFDFKRVRKGNNDNNANANGKVDGENKNGVARNLNPVPCPNLSFPPQPVPHPSSSSPFLSSRSCSRLPSWPVVPRPHLPSWQHCRPFNRPPVRPSNVTPLLSIKFPLYGRMPNLVSYPAPTAVQLPRVGQLETRPTMNFPLPSAFAPARAPRPFPARAPRPFLAPAPRPFLPPGPRPFLPPAPRPALPPAPPGPQPALNSGNADPLSPHEMSRQYDDDLVKKSFTRLMSTGEAGYPAIIERLILPVEAIVVKRFVAVLKLFDRQKSRKKAFSVARVMLQCLAMHGWSARDFVLLLMKSQVIPSSRLNIAVRLKYYTLSPTIFLDDIFNDQHSGANLRKALKNIPPSAVVASLKFLAENSRSPQAVLTAMRGEDAFAEGYVVDLAKRNFSEKELKFFIKFCCDAIGIKVPPEILPLFLRVRLDKELETFFRGETEPEDFHHICVGISEDKHNLMAYCVEYVGRKSAVLARFMATLQHLPYSPPPGADNFSPSCESARAFHEGACGKITVVDDVPAAKELDRRLSDCRYVAILYHVNASKGDGVCDLFSFRTRRHLFIYLPNQSGEFRDRVADSLVKKVAGKQVFVFRASKAAKFLEEEFRWKPTNLVDLRKLAGDNGIRPYMSDMAIELTGGFCPRARNYSAAAIVPSPVALLHHDADASTIYNFAVRFLNLRWKEVADAYEEGEERRRHRESRKRAADEAEPGPSGPAPNKYSRSTSNRR